MERRDPRLQLADFAARRTQQLEVVHSFTRDSPARLRGNAGPLTQDLLREAISVPDAMLVFCCGPGIAKHDRDAAKAKGVSPAPRFLKSVLDGLKAIGGPNDRVIRESYG
ncbi:MAG: hypothetical protein FJX57_22520 [Alphaproteobacteria bacterium]|nr:hypothetical protein [Alphaproteobacteria bacterium]